MRRLSNPQYQHIFLGDALDVGAGGDGLSLQRAHWPHLRSVFEWDMPNGDGQLLATCPDENFDVVHSSHFLEHVRDPLDALRHQLRVLRPGGHVVALIPDEDMYEQGVWPSSFNGDHKHTFSIFKARSWSPVHVDVALLLASLGDVSETLWITQVRECYDWSLPRVDQTGGDAPCAIEFVLRKRKPNEILFGGRVGRGRYE